MLVKINAELYKLAKNAAKTNSLEYPSMKNFVEKAVKRLVGFKKFDIEGIDDETNANKPLYDVVGESSGNYVMCALCDKVFFKEDATKGSNVRFCEDCSSALMQVVKAKRDERVGKRKIVKFRS